MDTTRQTSRFNDPDPQPRDFEKVQQELLDFYNKLVQGHKQEPSTQDSLRDKEDRLRLIGI